MRLVLIQLFPWSTTQSMSSKSWGYLLLHEIMGMFLHSILLNMCRKIRAEIKGKKRSTPEVNMSVTFLWISEMKCLKSASLQGEF